MNRRVVVLGATGSIGTQTLDVADALGIDVAAIAARRPSSELAEIARRYPGAVVIATGGSAEERSDFEAAVGRPAEFGPEAVQEAAALPGSTVVNGIVGAAGLRASLAALQAGNRLALANKESLVAGGPVVTRALHESTGELIPVDSEHSALYQCLEGEDRETVDRLILTASGGPFRGKTRDELADVGPEEALKHPTWDMGRRITIDSATLFNKGLEVIEAHFLFGIPYDRIDVVVHPQSILHSAVSFIDGSWKGHLGHADMRIPIQYALTSPGRASSRAGGFTLSGLELTFEDPDRDAFPALDLAYEAGRQGGSSPAVLNAADEIAVEAFLQGRLGFLGISDVVERTLSKIPWRDLHTVDDVVAADSEARELASGMISSAC